MDRRDSWVEAFRYIRKRDLVVALENVPDDTIIYRSPVTAGLVLCDQTGPDIDMSDEILPWSNGPVMTPPIDMKALLVWYPDGSYEMDSLDSEQDGWWSEGRVDNDTKRDTVDRP